MKMPRYGNLLSLLLSVIVLTSCVMSSVRPPDAGQATPATSQSTPITVCLSGSSSNSILILAESAGIYEKYDLAVTHATIASGTDAIRALLAGEVDVCQVGASAFVNAALAGERVVMTAGIINQIFFALAVRPEIGTAQDLIGKAVASSTPGSNTDSFLRLALAHLGLDPDTDVTFLSVGRSSDRLAAMATGSVGATGVVLSEVVTAKQMGFPILLYGAELDRPYQHIGMVVTREYLEENRDALKRLTMALIESIALMKSDKPQAIGALAAALDMDIDEDAATLSAIYDAFVIEYLERVPYPTESGLQVVIDENKAGNPTAQDVAPENIIDNSIVRELEEAGFIDQFYKNK